MDEMTQEELLAEAIKALSPPRIRDDEYTTPQMAEMHGVSKATIGNWRRDGDLDEYWTYRKCLVPTSIGWAYRLRNGDEDEPD